MIIPSSLRLKSQQDHGKMMLDKKTLKVFTMCLDIIKSEENWSCQIFHVFLDSK